MFIVNTNLNENLNRSALTAHCSAVMKTKTKTASGVSGESSQLKVCANRIQNQASLNYAEVQPKLNNAVVTAHRSSLIAQKFCYIRYSAYFRSVLRLMITVMTQIVLNVEDKSMLPGLRKILSNLNGVSIAKMRTTRKGTLSRAVEEVRSGQVTKVNSVAELMAELES